MKKLDKTQLFFSEEDTLENIKEKSLCFFRALTEQLSVEDNSRNRYNLKKRLQIYSKGYNFLIGLRRFEIKHNAPFKVELIEKDFYGNPFDTNMTNLLPSQILTCMVERLAGLGMKGNLNKKGEEVYRVNQDLVAATFMFFKNVVMQSFKREIIEREQAKKEEKDLLKRGFGSIDETTQEIYDEIAEIVRS